MSRKHFIELAKAIKTIEGEQNRYDVAKRIGAVCASQNSNFNWSTWMSACGIENW